MFFSKALVVLSIALSAMASPHMPRRVDHHGLARRAAIPVAEPEPVLAAPRRKRSSTGRCKVRSTSSAASSTAAPTSSALVVPQNVESDPASTSTPATTATPTSTPAETKPTSTPAETKPTSTPTPTTHHSTSAAAATSSAASSGNSGSSSSGPSYLTGTQTGDGTYYATGLGSCGITNQDSDHIVAVSHLLYDSYPGYNGANPNNNPVCGRKITATYQGKSVEVTVTDRCTGCAETDLDFSPSAFSELADFAVGRLHGMTWVWSS